MNYKFTFSQQELQTLSMALGELPLKLSLALFGKLQQGVAKQDAEQAVPLADIQRQFDAAVDAHDMPTGATKQPDPNAGD